MNETSSKANHCTTSSRLTQASKDKMAVSSTGSNDQGTTQKIQTPAMLRASWNTRLQRTQKVSTQSNNKRLWISHHSFFFFFKYSGRILCTKPLRAGDMTISRMYIRHYHSKTRSRRRLYQDTDTESWYEDQFVKHHQDAMVGVVDGILWTKRGEYVNAIA